MNQKRTVPGHGRCAGARHWTRTIALALLAGCGVGTDGPGEATDTAAAAPTPATVEPIDVSLQQFGWLRWLEGTWRGAGDGQETFYERYTMVDDSTLRAESSPDSTFPNPEEADAIRLRAGRVLTGDQTTMMWAVSSIDPSFVRFDPVAGATNAFEWRTNSDSAWTATLSWNDRAGNPQERIYIMRRLP